MAYATHTSPAREGSSVWQRLVTLCADLVERSARLRAYRTTVRELEHLGDRDLADMGIHRSQIGTIARQAALKA